MYKFLFISTSVLFSIILVKYTPQLAAGNQWLGFQRGAAPLWSKAGLMPRLRIRACKVAEGHLAASLLLKFNHRGQGGVAANKTWNGGILDSGFNRMVKGERFIQ